MPLALLTGSIGFHMVFVIHFGCFVSFRVFLYISRTLYISLGVYGEGFPILGFRNFGDYRYPYPYRTRTMSF